MGSFRKKMWKSVNWDDPALKRWLGTIVRPGTRYIYTGIASKEFRLTDKQIWLLELFSQRAS